jgi:hypothetical protein
VNGEVGSMASTETDRSWSRAAPTSSAARLDFPTPGEPVRPTVYALPVFGYSPAISSGSPSAPSSTIEMARATARRSPASTPSTNRPTSIVRPA